MTAVLLPILRRGLPRGAAVSRTGRVSRTRTACPPGGAKAIGRGGVRRYYCAAGVKQVDRLLGERLVLEFGPRTRCRRRAMCISLEIAPGTGRRNKSTSWPRLNGRSGQGGQED